MAGQAHRLGKTRLLGAALLVASLGLTALSTVLCVHYLSAVGLTSIAVGVAIMSFISLGCAFLAGRVTGMRVIVQRIPVLRYVEPLLGEPVRGTALYAILRKSLPASMIDRLYPAITREVVPR